MSSFAVGGAGAGEAVPLLENRPLPYEMHREIVTLTHVPLETSREFASHEASKMVNLRIDRGRIRELGIQGLLRILSNTSKYPNLKALSFVRYIPADRIRGFTAEENDEITTQSLQITEALGSRPITELHFIQCNSNISCLAYPLVKLASRTLKTLSLSFKPLPGLFQLLENVNLTELDCTVPFNTASAPPEEITAVNADPVFANITELALRGSLRVLNLTAEYFGPRMRQMFASFMEMPHLTKLGLLGVMGVGVVANQGNVFANPHIRELTVSTRFVTSVQVSDRVNVQNFARVLSENRSITTLQLDNTYLFSKRHDQGYLSTPEQLELCREFQTILFNGLATSAVKKLKIGFVYHVQVLADYIASSSLEHVSFDIPEHLFDACRAIVLPKWGNRDGLVVNGKTLKPGTQGLNWPFV